MLIGFVFIFTVLFSVFFGVLGVPGVLGVLLGDLHWLLRPARFGAVAKQQRVLEEIYICLRANHILCVIS